MDEDDKMREAIAKHRGIQLYEQYNEATAAAFLKVDHSTLKRWRKRGKVPFIAMGDRPIRYFGYQIVDILRKGTGWDGDDKSFA